MDTIPSDESFPPLPGCWWPSDACDWTDAGAPNDKREGLPHVESVPPGSIDAG